MYKMSITLYLYIGLFKLGLRCTKYVKK